MLDYPLPRIHALLAAIDRGEAERRLDLLDTIFVASRGNAESVEVAANALKGLAGHEG